MKPKKNYIDERGNYHNVENLTLTQIHDRAGEEGYRLGKSEAKQALELLDYIKERYILVEKSPTDAPAIEKRPQGEWIIVKDEKRGDNVKCPFCGKELAGTDLNFCCKCGADMRKDGQADE